MIQDPKKSASSNKSSLGARLRQGDSEAARLLGKRGGEKSHGGGRPRKTEQ